MRKRLAELLGRDLGDIEIVIRARLKRPRPRADVEPLVDESNEMLWRLLQRLAKGVDAMFNPVFVYGGQGVGKSFLIQAFLERFRGPSSVWRALDYHQTFVRHYRSRCAMKWRTSLLRNKVFVVEEVHRLASKPKTQQELASLIDELRARSVQIVFSARHHPRNIRALGHALQSRFLGGFTVELPPPPPESRRRFLQRLGVNPHARPELARNVLAAAQSYGDVMDRLDDLDAGAALPHRRRTEAGSKETVVAILDRVGRHFGIEVDDLLSPDKSRRVTLPRQIAVWLARKSGVSGAEMARRLGWQSASTATYAVHRVDRRMEADADVRRAVRACRGRPLARIQGLPLSVARPQTRRWGSGSGC